jgi:hypothetical protein
MRLRALSARIASPYIAVTLAVAAVATFCYAMVVYGGVERGLGALFWLVVIWSALRFGLWPGIWAAVSAAAANDFLLIPPRYTLSVGLPTTIITAAFLISVIYLAAQRQARALVVVPRFWNEQETGNYWKDCAHGERRAQEFMRVLRARQEGFMMGLMVRDMIRSGRFGGIEVGFFHRISATLQGRDLLRLVPTADHDTEDLGPQHGVVEAEDEIEPLAVRQK